MTEVNDSPAQLPLVVDLDGTLVLSDTLHESYWQLLRRRPFVALATLGRLSEGKASFKRAIRERVLPDVQSLPYNESLLAQLRSQRTGRLLVLCTGADEGIARAVADHVQVFDDVMASDGAVNLTGERKADALAARFGERGFDYVGNDTADLPVFRKSRTAHVANPTRGLLRVLGTVPNIGESAPPASTGLQALWRALRPHQWLKNVLVFLPLLTATGVDHWHGLIRSFTAFIAFSLVASGVYLVNDLLDLDVDRRHPRKRRRPIAAGHLAIPSALLAAAFSFAVGFGTALFVSELFAATLLIYLLVTSAYMLRLKRVPILDSIVLATLYTLRMIGGAAALAVAPSFWLLAFSMCLFMSLALGKRLAELLELEDADGRLQAIPGRSYRPEDLQTIVAQGNATGIAAVIVLALYIHGGLEPGQYGTPQLLWGLCPILLYWISKFWLNAQRREITVDPVIWAAENRVSRALVLLAVALVAGARWLVL